MENSLATSTEFHIAAMRLLTQMQETINRLLDLTTPPSTEALKAAVPDFESVVSMLGISPQTTGDSDVPPQVPIEHVHNNGVPTLQITGDPDQPVRNPSTWYSVLVGRNPGVFHGSNGLTENIGGISHNSHNVHDSRAAAIEAYLDALASGDVVKVTLIETREVIHENDESVFVRE